MALFVLKMLLTSNNQTSVIF